MSDLKAHIREILQKLVRHEIESADCACGHPWERHARQSNGAFACRHFGCGCRDVVQR